MSPAFAEARALATPMVADYSLSTEASSARLSNANRPPRLGCTSLRPSASFGNHAP
jgi:hypothetical protein